GSLPFIYVSRFFLLIENRCAMSSGRALALPTDRSTQPRAVDDDEIFASAVREILETVAEVAAIEQEVAGLEGMLGAIKGDLEAALGHVKMLLDALAMRRKRAGFGLRRQAVQ